MPIVFANASDPVAAGLVASLARPGVNVTGFTTFEFGMGAKWLELLKQIAPAVTRAAVLRDPTVASGIGVFSAIEAVAPMFGVEPRPVDIHDPTEIEHAMIPFIGSRNRVYEVLSRKRPLTIAMIWRLHEGLGIPAESLIKADRNRAA